MQVIDADSNVSDAAKLAASLLGDQIHADQAEVERAMQEAVVELRGGRHREAAAKLRVMSECMRRWAAGVDRVADEVAKGVG